VTDGSEPARTGRRVLLAVVLLLAPAGLDAQGFGDPFELRWEAETETAVGLDGVGLQKWDLLLRPELSWRVSGVGEITGIARLRIDPPDELEPGQPGPQDGVRAPPTRRLFVGDPADLELRELYLDRYLGDVFLRVGKQQVVWGQADELTVLNVVNPFQFREFVLADFADRRIPLWTVNAQVPVGPATAQLLWIPDHSYDEVPERPSPFAPTSPRLVPRVDPAAVEGPVTVTEADRPDELFADDDYGARLTAFLGGWDLGLHYLYHHRDRAVPVRRPEPGGGVRIRPEYRRSHLAGASASNAFGDVVLRGEMAYSTDRSSLTADPGDRDGVFETGELGYVLGADYEPNADLFVSAQLFQSVFTEHPAGAVRDRADTQVTVLVERELRNDSLTPSLTWVQGVNEGDGLVQADVEWEYRTGVVLKAGLDLFYGDRNGLFGQFGDADRLTAGVEWGL